MEACGSAHHWGRAIRDAGHEVRLIPPAYVKPFVKRQKNDAADAEAIAEAASRPTMRFVAVKTEEQQARAMLFRTRDLLVRQRRQPINALRGQLSEHGVVAPQGPANVAILAQAIDDMTPSLPLLVVELGRVYLDQIDGPREIAVACMSTSLRYLDTALSRDTRTTSSATAEAKKKPAGSGMLWRSASGPADWFSILRRRSSSIARIRTGVATFRSSRLIFSATPFVRDKRFGTVVVTALPSCQRPVRRR